MSLSIVFIIFLYINHVILFVSEIATQKILEKYKMATL
jgi:hypothetical protein